MSRQGAPLSPEVRALLEHERAIPPLPDTVRARALARARAAVVANGPVLPAPSAGSARRFPWAVAAAVACAVSATIGAGAYAIGRHFATSREVGREAPGLTVVAARPPAPPPAATTLVEPEPPAAPRGVTSRPSRDDAGALELRLLREARAAVARGDFDRAMLPISEHAQRFKRGRLAEEREALRVKALAALGRTGEARRAAAAFQVQYPRSVLLPVVRQMADAAP